MQSYIIPANETPEQASLRRRRQIAGALMQQRQPTNIGEGLAAIGDAITYRQEQQNAAFPTAPGSVQPSWGTAMKNLFTGGKNGGLW